MLSLMLDVLSLIFLLSFLLSGLVAMLPPIEGDPCARAVKSLWRLFLPPIAAIFLVLAAFWPSVRMALTGAADHCAGGEAGHAHLCWLHLSPGSLGSAHDGVVVGLFALQAAVLLYQGFRWVQAHAAMRMLESMRRKAREAEARKRLAVLGFSWPADLWVVSLPLPMCFLMGAIQPRLVIAEAVLDELSDGELAAMVAHEAAHLQRHDNLWRMLGGLAILGHLPGLGERTYSRWLESAESACDAVAAKALGSPFPVAEALVKFQRMLNRSAAAPSALAFLGTGFAGPGHLASRVEGLLTPPTATRQPLRYAYGVALLLVLPLAETIHQLFEYLLHLLHA